MSAYTDAIGRARSLLDGPRPAGQEVTEYERALIELCATFDPEGPMDEAIERAKALINYNPERRVEFTIRVPEMAHSDKWLSATIQEAINRAVLPFSIDGPVIVEATS